MPYKVRQKVLFRHCDPAGIVFYPRYLEMVNDCVEELFEDIGYPFHDMHMSHGVPTVKLNATFIQPSRQGDMLDITITPTHIGKASLELAVNCSCAGEERFDIDVTLVQVTKDMQSQPWSDAVRNKLAAYIAADLQAVSHG